MTFVKGAFVKPPKLLIITLKRWLCSKGHHHTKPSFAVACDKPKKQHPKFEPPVGFINTDDAKGLFHDADLRCSRYHIGLMVKVGLIAGIHRGGTKGRLYVFKRQVVILVKTKKHSHEILGIKEAERKECSICKRRDVAVRANKIARHYSKDKEWGIWCSGSGSPPFIKSEGDDK